MATPLSGGTFQNAGEKQTIFQEIMAHKFPEWEDEEVTSMLFMDSPLYVIVLVTVYMGFVLKVGPHWMRNRQPFGLRYTMMAYNVFQVAINTMFIVNFLSESGIYNHLLTESAHPIFPSRNKRLRLHGLYYTWFWWLIKVSDLIDTVIFVLRKKQSHVSFLHVYHHFNMVFFTWIYFRYIRGESLIIAGVINSFVHVPMYSYYFLAALGPSVQKHLWWKRYLTKLQLAQFCIVFTLHVYLAVFGTVPTIQRLFIYFSIAQTVIFMILFGNFYRKAYKTANNTGAQKYQHKKAN